MSIAAESGASWLAGVPIESSSTLFFIGHDDVSLRAGLAQRDWRGRIIRLSPPGFDGLEEVARSLEPDAANPVVVLQPGIVGHHREAVKEAARRIGRAWFGARANVEAKRQNGARYLLNTLRNIDAIASEGDVTSLAGLLPGVPVIVVGAGPSLDRNVADIRQYRDRACVICADTALRPLLAAGIEPDIVVAADPTETNARHLNDLRPCPRTRLVAEGSVDPESLNHFRGRTFFFRVDDHHPWPWFESAGLNRGRLRSWGSVLTTAFDLALVMKCDPVIFAGADLAFTEGRPYARGTTFEEVWLRAEASGQTLEDCWAAGIAGWPPAYEAGVDGTRIRTAPHLRSFRDWIAAEAARNAGRTIINGTGGGILVGTGITQATLADALARLEPCEERLRPRIGEAHRMRAGMQPTTRQVDQQTLVAWRTFAGSALDEAELLRAIGHELPSEAVPVDPEPAQHRPHSSTLVIDGSTQGDLTAAIEDAWQHCQAERLVLDDRTNAPGGAAVRRALFRFLDGHPELGARWGRFFDPFSTTAWIDRRSSTQDAAGVDLDKFLPHHEQVAARLASLVVERMKPASVLDVGCGAGYWLRALEANGVTDVSGVDDAALVAASKAPVAPGVSAIDLSTFEPSRKVDLCLCLCVVQRTPPSVADWLVTACTKSSDTVVFAAPSPGVGAPGFINERSSSYWNRLFLEHGFAPVDELRPAIEERWGGYRSSYDLLKVYQRIAARGEDLPPAARIVLLESAARVDDLVLQSHWATSARSVEAASRPPMPSVRFEALTIAPARMDPVSSGARSYRFRTSAPAFWLSTPDVDIVVEEAGVRLERVAHSGALRPGAFAIEGDTVLFRSRDGSDPRHNRRRYTVRVPATVAWMEALPLETIVEHRL